MNQAAGGRNPMTAHANTTMLVRIGQLRAATHGDESLHVSQPSAHFKQTNVLFSPYADSSFCSCKLRLNPHIEMKAEKEKERKNHIHSFINEPLMISFVCIDICTMLCGRITKVSIIYLLYVYGFL